MAERRMFAKTVIDSDAFLDMALSTQALYFHLSMRADDDGFVNNPKKIMRMVGAGEDELKVLVGKKFIIGFESGIIVIKHWKLHNYIQKDRYKATVYHEEMNKIGTKDNNVYTMDTKCVQDGDTGKVRLGKDRLELGKDRLGKVSLYEHIIKHLNNKTAKSFRTSSKKTQSLIDARLKEGFTQDDFIKVIDIKCSKWIKDKNMKDYLRPETLFGSKFESYLNEKNDIKDQSWRDEIRNGGKIKDAEVD